MQHGELELAIPGLKEERIRSKNWKSVEEELLHGQEKLTCYPGIGSNELGACGPRHVFSNCQLGFQSLGFLGLLTIVGAGFVFFTEEIPNEVPSALIEIIEGVFWLGRREAVRSA